MALVSLWAAASVALAWRAGLIKLHWALLATLAALLACALAEVKVAIVLLPLLALAVGALGGLLPAWRVLNTRQGAAA